MPHSQRPEALPCPYVAVWAWYAMPAPADGSPRRVPNKGPDGTRRHRRSCLG